MIHYPQEVEEQLYAVVSAVKMHTKASEESLHDIFGDFLFNKWLTGEESFEDMETIAPGLLKRAAALDVYKNLTKNGLIDSIECDGEEVVFLTEKGRSHYGVQSLEEVKLNAVCI